MSKAPELLDCGMKYQAENADVQTDAALAQLVDWVAQNNSIAELNGHDPKYWTRHQQIEYFLKELQRWRRCSEP